MSIVDKYFTRIQIKVLKKFYITIYLPNYKTTVSVVLFYFVNIPMFQTFYISLSFEIVQKLVKY